MTYEEAKKITEECRQAAVRACYSAGLIEQVKNAETELETLDALANFDANLYTKSYAIIDEWHDVMNFFKFKSIEKIGERGFMESKGLTVGEYLEISAKNKMRPSDATTGYFGEISA